MAPDRLRAALQTLPFQPFKVELANGKSIPIIHPDYAHLSPVGRTLIVYGREEEWSETIDVFLITNLAHGDAKPSRHRTQRKA